MPSDPSDEVLIEATADAAQGGRVLFLHASSADRTPVLATRARRLAVDRIRERYGDDASRALFSASDNPWLLKPSTGGWLLFYPSDVINADDDVENPTTVYWPNDKGQYAKVTYDTWRKSRRAGNILRPRGKREPEGPRTMWDRLLDDDFEA